MSSLAKPPAELIRTDRHDWKEELVQCLLDGDNALVVDRVSGKQCFIPGGRFDGPVWRYARPFLREAGIPTPSRPR
jgi:hypothetical protein